MIPRKTDALCGLPKYQLTLTSPQTKRVITISCNRIQVLKSYTKCYMNSCEMADSQDETHQYRVVYRGP